MRYVVIGAIATAIILGASQGQSRRPDLFMSPTGSDAHTCTSIPQACLTFNHVYSIASPGNLVQVLSGTYTSQPDVLKGTQSQTGPMITFQCETRHACKVSGGLSLGTANSSGSSNESPSFLTFDGVDFIQGSLSLNDDDANSGYTYTSVTIENSHVWDLQSFGNDSGTTDSIPAAVYLWGSGQNVLFDNVEIGPTCCDEDGMASVGTNVTVNHMYMHDILGSCSQFGATLQAAFPPATYATCTGQGFNDGTACTSCEHPDGWQSYGGNNVTMENSRIFNAAAQPVFFSTFHHAYTGTLRFENNMVSFPYSSNPDGCGPHGCSGGEGVSFGNNGWDNCSTGGTCLGTNSGPSTATLIIRNNTIQDVMRIYTSGFFTGATATVANNYIADYGTLNGTSPASYNGCSGVLQTGAAMSITYEYNAMNPACGGTDANVTPTFVNTSWPYDLHLSPSDTHAIDKVLTGTDYPATDFDGDTRPCGAHTDIGADEHC